MKDELSAQKVPEAMQLLLFIVWFLNHFEKRKQRKAEA